jgi:integrase
MAIFKRGKHWHIDVTVHGVRYREALETTDRREALMLVKKRIAEIEQGKAASPTGKEFARRGFSEAAGVFIEDRIGHVSARTTQFERERTKSLKEFFGDKPLLKITAGDIKAYQKQRLEAGLSGKTINMDVGVLRLMLKRAKTWNIVAQDVKLFPKRSRVIGKVLTQEQKLHLFQVAGTKDDWLVAHCAAVLAVSTTCRGVELKHLHWRDVDLFAQAMIVKRSKTDAGHRTIPLNGDAMRALARLRERADAVGAGLKDHFVFPACENGHIDPTKPQKSWRTAWRSLVKEAAKRAGDAAAKQAAECGADPEEAREHAADPFKGFRFHDLRHQAITEMAEKGASDATIMAVAGHIDRAMMEHYSHVRMAAKREVLGQMESGLISAPPADAEPASQKVN